MDIVSHLSHKFIPHYIAVTGTTRIFTNLSSNSWHIIFPTALEKVILYFLLGKQDFGKLGRSLEQIKRKIDDVELGRVGHARNKVGA